VALNIIMMLSVNMGVFYLFDIKQKQLVNLKFNVTYSLFINQFHYFLEFIYRDR
jgi:hypothetical protein